MHSAASVAVLDGLAEGPRHTTLLRQALQHHGYSIADDPALADVVVAHSAGMLFLPDTAKRQLTVLINPPYWPGKSLLVSSVEKVARDLAARARERQLARWVLKTCWNVIYLVLDLARAVRIARLVRRRRLPQIVAERPVVIVRNERDAWCAPDIDRRLVAPWPIELHRLPGEHDDCLHHPEPYVALLDALVGRAGRDGPQPTV